jgi:hypothetical protein
MVDNFIGAGPIEFFIDWMVDHLIGSGLIDMID